MQSDPATAGNAATSCASFDPDELEKSDWKARLFAWLFSYPVHRYWMDVLRWFTPAIWVPFVKFWLVLRYDAVREVLNQDGSFPVPWGWKMVEVTGGVPHGRNFVLGMARAKEGYQLSYDQLAEAFPLADVGKHVAPLSAAAAASIIDHAAARGKGELDAIEDLVTAVPTALCESYYGIEIPDKVAFAKWTLAISSYLFGPPFAPGEQQPADVQLAHSAAACLRGTILHSIGEARSGRMRGIVMERMMKMLAEGRIQEEAIHAQLFGMVMGFIPTNVLAGGNILETLLRQPEFMKRSRAAAIAGDDDQLWRCLREALRFRNINPGPFRVSAGDYVINRGAINEVRIRKGESVLASTQAAMFDARRVQYPKAYNPERPDEDYLVFGVGQHWCLGAYIAIAQITQTLKPLLRRDGLAALEGRRGEMRRFRVFPLHLHVRFRP